MPTPRSDQTAPVEIFTIGTASLDVLHFAGQTARTAGGAGLYTALAAHRAGARAGLFAPRPEPMPGRLRPVADRLIWLGPGVPPQRLPRLEIEHHGGGRATLLDAAWGAEAQLSPAGLPPQIWGAAIVHIAALSSAQRQLDFLEAIRQQGKTGEQGGRGARGQRKGPTGGRTRISVGTYARLVYGDAERVRRLFELADLFFMNKNEARGLFGSLEQARTRAGALLFVTLGAAGALVIEGERVSRIPGQPATELDPTGAGDTFCGATLAGLVKGKSPVVSARQAVALAAQTVGQVGPAALLKD